MGGHLQVVVVLHIVTGHRSDSPIDNHKLAVESPQRRSVEIDHFQVDARNILRVRQANIDVRPALCIHILMVVEDLSSSATIVHDSDHNDLAATLAAGRQLAKSIGDVCARLGSLPEIRGEQDLVLSASDKVGDVSQLIMNRSDDCHGHNASRSTERWRAAVC